MELKGLIPSRLVAGTAETAQAIQFHAGAGGPRYLGYILWSDLCGHRSKQGPPTVAGNHREPTHKKREKKTGENMIQPLKLIQDQDWSNWIMKNLLSNVWDSQSLRLNLWWFWDNWPHVPESPTWTYEADSIPYLKRPLLEALCIPSMLLG